MIVVFYSTSPSLRCFKVKKESLCVSSLDLDPTRRILALSRRAVTSTELRKIRVSLLSDQRRPAGSRTCHVGIAVAFVQKYEDVSSTAIMVVH